MKLILLVCLKILLGKGQFQSVHTIDTTDNLSGPEVCHMLVILTRSKNFGEK